MTTDYMQATFWFRFKKAARYVRIYGLSRTLIKIRGHYHMKATGDFAGTWRNAGCKSPEASERNVAIIGCGNYAFSNIAYYLGQRQATFLRATYDMNKSRSLSLCKYFGGAYAADDWRTIIADPQVKVIFVASNHASHAEYAIACLDAGKNVYIEKPHVVSEDQLDRLVAAMERNPKSRVFLGFNRPKSRLIKDLQAFLAKEDGPLMINWFIAGHEIPEGHWYLDEKEGGRVLGNLCHWTDLTLHLVSMDKAFPCIVMSASPASTTSDFVVSVIFADLSCAAITFSAKGHTFEGVRETLNVHKGNVVANLTDFRRLSVDVIDRKYKTTLVFRDHGHKANIVDAAEKVADGRPGESTAYVSATGRFFMAFRKAIDTGKEVVVGI